MKESDTKGLFWQWGRFVFRFRWYVVSIWVILFLCLSLFALKTPGMLHDNGFTPYDSESDTALNQLQSELDLPASSIQLVYESDELDLSSTSHQQTILDSLEAVKDLPFVGHVSFNRATKKANTQGVLAVQIPINLDTDESLQQYPLIRDLVYAPEGMKVHVTGGTAVMYDMQAASKQDILKAELIGLPIALLVLLIIFGTVLSALLPMIVGVMSVTITLGGVYFIADKFSLSNFMPSIITMLGLAVGIDYALFMVSRFREELKRQATIEEAVAMTCQHAGKSIFFSGIAVLIGLLGMLFIKLNLFYSLSFGGILVVSISVVLANTLLLALLGLFGHKINVLQIIPASWKRKKKSDFWKKVAFMVMKRPLSLVIVLGTVLVILMLPMSDMKMGVPAAEVLPPSYESRLGSDLLDATYDEREMSPIQISVSTEQEVGTEQSIHSMDEYLDKLEELTNVRQIQKGLARNHTALIAIVPESSPESRETDGLVREIRALKVEGLETLVTGEAAYRMDIIQRINEGIPYVFIFVMGMTYIILMFAFRSMLLPLKAVFMNVLGLGASLGVVVSVFQKGMFADLIHITSIGYVNATLPVLIFCVVFGISMDYEVFLISRIAEEYEKSGDNEQSTAEGLRKTGGLITSAAAILIVVVGTFIFADIEIMKALGLGLALAVLIDATIIRIILVPALMKLLGKANWWAPKWLNPIKHD